MAKNYVTKFRGEIYFTPNGNLRIKDEPVTPIEEDFGEHNNLDRSYEDHYGMRKSLSMNDIIDHGDTRFNETNESDAYQRARRPTGAPLELSRTKFVSMAEAIYHYQRDTPGRFHSTKPQLFRSQTKSNHGPKGLTVAQSPMLRSKTRSRPTHVLSQKEKEEMELEEIRKHKIKANPIPKSVLDGAVNLPDVSKKAATIPEPFKLTEIQKKVAQCSVQAHTFKARPVPKLIMEKPQIPVKLPIPITKPVSAKFLHKRSVSVDHLKNDKDHHKCTEKNPPRLGPIRPEPFSFEKRDEELKRRRDEWVKRQIVEERKLAGQFKAQPLPGAVKKRMQSATTKGSSSTSSDNKENQFKFEARPPTVLYKEPFKPILHSAQVVKSVPFMLTSEKRAAEREKFDNLLKIKEEEHERMRKQREKEQQEAEEKLKAELRAKLVHHAKPVPAFSTYKPEKSVIPLTVPETPKFVRRLQQH